METTNNNVNKKPVKAKRKTYGTAEQLVYCANIKVQRANTEPDPMKEYEYRFLAKGIIYTLKAQGYKCGWSEEKQKYVMYETRDQFKNRNKYSKPYNPKKPKIKIVKNHWLFIDDNDKRSLKK